MQDPMANDQWRHLLSGDLRLLPFVAQATINEAAVKSVVCHLAADGFAVSP